MKDRLRQLMNRQAWAKGLFWSWNIIFLAFMFLGFAPAVLRELITAVRAGEIPAQFLVYAAVLTLIPAVVMLVGFFWLRRQPEKLFALGYSVEGPLMLILAIRFFIVRQSTPAIALILITAGLGILTFLWQLLDRKIDQRGPVTAHLRFIGLTLLLIVGLYASLWLTFYVIPLAAQSGEILSDGWRQLWRSLSELDWRSIEWRQVPFVILYIPLLLFTGALFVLMPIAVSILYTRTWLRGLRALKARYNRTRTAALTTAVLLTLTLLLIQTDKQPQHQAFALLETPPATLSEAESLLAQEEAIRSGLLNAYLAPQRYVSAVGEMDHIRWIYEDTFDITTEQAQDVQQFYETVARPILYQPVNPVPASSNRWENRVFDQRAGIRRPNCTDNFFDEPIVDGERGEPSSALCAPPG